MDNASVATISQDTKNTNLLLWILTLFFGFIPGLIFFFTKKDDPSVLQQSKEALNWGITAVIGYFISMVLMLVLIGVFVMGAIGIAHLVFCIMGAVAASNGKEYKVPFSIRLIK